MESEIIQKILEFSKDKIENSDLHNIDRTAKVLVDLLEYLGREEEADFLYNFYQMQF